MVRPPRDAPTPAAVVTYVGLGTFALAYALTSWYERLWQAGDGVWAWPTDPVTTARSAAGWALTVSLWCAVLWAASVRGTRLGHPWRPAALAAAVIVAWTALAWRSASTEATEWFVPWPGPVPGMEFALVGVGVESPLVPRPGAIGPLTVGHSALTPRPGLVTPLVLLAAVSLVAVLARRHAARHPVAVQPTPSRSAHRTALAVLAAPVVAFLVAATLLQVPGADQGTPVQRYLSALEQPGFGLALAIAAALMLAGTGPGGWVLLGLVQLSVAGPIVLQWWHGGADSLLATAALGMIAVAAAAAVRPTATAISRLDGGPSVPERADADDRAWA